MKHIFILLIALFCYSCGEKSTESKSTSSEVVVESESKVTEKKPVKIFDKMVGTWYAKEVLVNGKSDQENYPVKNDELTLNADKSVVSIDRTVDVVDNGTWSRLSEKHFAITSNEERVVFQIMKLTETVLETKLVSDDIDMKINYSKVK